MSFHWIPIDVALPEQEHEFHYDYQLEVVGRHGKRRFKTRYGIACRYSKTVLMTVRDTSDPQQTRYIICVGRYRTELASGAPPWLVLSNFGPNLGTCELPNKHQEVTHWGRLPTYAWQYGNRNLQPGWHSVQDGIPPNHDLVFIFNQHGGHDMEPVSVALGQYVSYEQGALQWRILDDVPSYPSAAPVLVQAPGESGLRPAPRPSPVWSVIHLNWRAIAWMPLPGPCMPAPVSKIKLDPEPELATGPPPPSDLSELVAILSGASTSDKFCCLFLGLLFGFLALVSLRII